MLISRQLVLGKELRYVKEFTRPDSHFIQNIMTLNEEKWWSLHVATIEQARFGFQHKIRSKSSKRRLVNTLELVYNAPRNIHFHFNTHRRILQQCFEPKGIRGGYLQVCWKYQNKTNYGRNSPTSSLFYFFNFLPKLGHEDVNQF